MSPAGKSEGTDGSGEGKTDTTSVMMSETADDSSAEQADDAADAESGAEQPKAGPSAPVVAPDDVEASAAVPPWQRLTSEVRRPEAESPYSPASSGQPPTGDGFDYRNFGWTGNAGSIGNVGARVVYADQEQTITNLQPVLSAPTENFLGGVEPEPPLQTPRGRMPVGLGGSGPRQPGGSTPSALRRPGRGPRRASLQVKRMDPWSVLKLALVLSIALFFVWLVAVGVLYGVLDGMGVWDKLNGTYSDLVQPRGGGTDSQLISAGKVFGIAAIIGGINIVLITALSTVAAFIYNVSADLAGGLEITLAERE